MIPRATKRGGWPRVGLSRVGFLMANRERCDKALMVPNLYVETPCQLHCLLASLFIVGALHNFGAPQKVATASDGVDAI
jgi:hypothetical protein